MLSRAALLGNVLARMLEPVPPRPQPPDTGAGGLLTALARRWCALPEEWRGVGVVVAFASVVFLPRLGAVGLWDPWEPHYAEVAREMIVRDDYVFPYWESAYFFSKPALAMWMSALAMKVAGVGWRGLPPGSVAGGPTPSGLSAYTEWAVRLPVAVAAILACALVFVAMR